MAPSKAIQWLGFTSHFIEETSNQQWRRYKVGNLNLVQTSQSSQDYYRISIRYAINFPNFIDI